MLPPDEVHVWWFGLDEDGGDFEELLSEAEIARANRFVFPRDRRRFLRAHGWLRLRLAQYLRTPPRELQLNQGAHGKPAVEGLRFNLSHSHGVALLAVAGAREVGADVERIRPGVAGENIADRFFSPRECAALRAVPDELQARAFFDCWTRKEAYIKAKGRGLAIPLDGFEVAFAPGEPPRLLRDLGEPDDAEGWTLSSFSLAEGYAAAVAVQGRDCRFRLCSGNSD